MKEEFYDLVERSIDVAFENDKFLFRCYDYMKSTKTTRKDCREFINSGTCLLYTSPSPRDLSTSRMPSSA